MSYPFNTFVKNRLMAYTLKYFKIQTRCLQCGREIMYGRADRKFCCKECKNQYHNRRRYPLREEMEGSVLRRIDLNHAILERLYKMGVYTIDLITLSHLGFDAHFITSYRRVGRHDVFAIFDLQYEMTPSRLKNLVCLLEEKDITEPEREM
jgi:hypothetical protein